MLIDLARLRSFMGRTASGRPTPFGTGVQFAADSSTAALAPLQSLYACTDTTAPRTFTINSADIAKGRPLDPWIFTIKDQSGGANANNIAIVTEGAETIDGGAATAITADFGSVTLYSDGLNLFST